MNTEYINRIIKEEIDKFLIEQENTTLNAFIDSENVDVEYLNNGKMVIGIE